MDKLDKMSASLAKNLPVEAKEKTLKNSLSPEEIEFVFKNKSILNNTRWEFIMSHLANANDILNKSN